jgi:aerobic carbon-monoxide dehydrogenase small subunit
VNVRFLVNGAPTEVDVPGMRRLLDVLREDLGLTGTKEGCGEGECGACSVILDGDVVDACLVPICQVDGSVVRTVEGLAPRGAAALDELQTAFLETGGAQCGICTPGMLMAARAYLDDGGTAEEAAIREAIAGNLCRCTGYTKIVEAIALAAGGSWLMDENLESGGPVEEPPKPAEPAEATEPSEAQPMEATAEEPKEPAAKRKSRPAKTRSRTAKTATKSVPKPTTKSTPRPTAVAKAKTTTTKPATRAATQVRAPAPVRAKPPVAPETRAAQLRRRARPATSKLHIGPRVVAGALAAVAAAAVGVVGVVRGRRKH